MCTNIHVLLIVISLLLLLFFVIQNNANSTEGFNGQMHDASTLNDQLYFLHPTKGGVKWGDEKILDSYEKNANVNDSEITEKHIVKITSDRLMSDSANIKLNETGLWNINVKKGTQLQFVNEDSSHNSTHNIVFEESICCVDCQQKESCEWRMTGDLDKGQSRSFNFNKVGFYKFYCYHPEKYTMAHLVGRVMVC